MKFLLGLGLLICSLSFAKNYAPPRLAMRAGAISCFGLPLDSKFSQASLALAPDGRIAVVLTELYGRSIPAVWVGGGKKTLVTDPGSKGTLYGDLSFTSHGTLLLHAFSSAGFTKGIREIEKNAESGRTVLHPQALTMKTQSLSGPWLLADWSTIAFNYVGEGGGRGYCRHPFYGPTECLVRDASLDDKSPYSYLFTASFGIDGTIAAKVRLGKPGELEERRPDQILRWSETGVATVLATDSDGDPLSPYQSFDNSVSYNAAGQVAFGANLVAGGRGIFRSDGKNVIAIVKTGAGSTVESFALGPKGDVAYLALTKEKKQQIVVSDGMDTTVLATAGDTVDTDLGKSTIEGFGHKLAVDENGHVAFFAGLDGIDGEAAFISEPK